MQVTERFLKYVSFDTTSSETSDTVPTTAHQKELGRYLADELARLGLENAHMDQLGYVYAVLPATPGQEHVPALGLISHMDTSPAVSGADIHPQIVTYQGGDLPLAKTGCLRVKDFPFLSRYVGQELIVTDGTTLLGADDKAGVAEIVTACEYLLAHPEIPHRTVAVCFTPDEEVGKGTDHFDPAKFPAKAAYTVDGGELGEIEVSRKGERFCLAVGPKGAAWVHEHTDPSGFLADFIAAIGRHGCTMDELLAIFRRHGERVHVEALHNGEFDWLGYFEDGKPDAYCYCIADEGCHLTYHRFTKEDYEAFGFETT